MRKMKISASVTVEASFIIPIIFFALLSLMVLCMYGYDRVCLQSEMILSCEQVLEMGREAGNLPEKNEIEDITGRTTGTEYFLCTAEISVTECFMGTAELTGVMVMAIPDAGIFGGALQKIKESGITEHITYTDRERMLRLISIGTRTWDRMVN